MLCTLIALSAQSRSESPDSPSDVVTKLWKSAADGKLLSVEGWNNTSGFFVNSSPPPERNSFLVISNDWSVGPVIVHGDKAEVDVNYIAAGKIDTSLRYSQPPKTPYMKTGVAYHLISTPRHDSTLGPDEKTASATWKIEDPRGLPWTTVDGAIRYTTEMRGKSPAAVTKNAGDTLVRLAKLH